MKVWQGTLVLEAILLITSVCGSACSGDCDEEFHRVESGQYTILNRGLGVLNWLAGGQMDIDLPAKTTILRYTRDGTTYEVEFMLEE